MHFLIVASEKITNRINDSLLVCSKFFWRYMEKTDVFIYTYVRCSCYGLSYHVMSDPQTSVQQRPPGGWGASLATILSTCADFHYTASWSVRPWVHRGTRKAFVCNLHPYDGTACWQVSHCAGLTHWFFSQNCFVLVVAKAVLICYVM